MAHVSLDDTQVDAGFEEMSGIGVAEGVNGDAFFWDSCSNLGPAEGTLDTALGHGRWSVLCSITVSTKGGEEEARMTVGDPIAAEQMEGGLRERHVAIFGALPTVDMDHHAGGIDIGDFEVETFMESQAAGIDGGKIGVILEGFDLGKNGSDFFNAKNGRESSLILGSEDSENVPVSLEDVFVEEANSAIVPPRRDMVLGDQ